MDSVLKAVNRVSQIASLAGDTQASTLTGGRRAGLGGQRRRRAGPTHEPVPRACCPAGRRRRRAALARAPAAQDRGGGRAELGQELGAGGGGGPRLPAARHGHRHAAAAGAAAGDGHRPQRAGVGRVWPPARPEVHRLWCAGGGRALQGEPFQCIARIEVGSLGGAGGGGRTAVPGASASCAAASLLCNPARLFNNRPQSRSGRRLRMRRSGTRPSAAPSCRRCPSRCG